MKDALYIVMPAYNESENIEATVKQWHAVADKVGGLSKLVIFNDGSKDSTFEILSSLEKSYPRLIAKDKANSGHGPTCIAAYNYAIDAKAEYIFQTDSDGQTNPDEFWNFWELRNSYDFIIGYRNNREDGFSRVIITKVLTIVVFLSFGKIVKDCNTPFRLMKATSLKPILNVMPKDFFLANVIVSLMVVKEKLSHTWLPISFKVRQGGENSINIKQIFNIGLKSIVDFIKIKKNIRGYNKR